MERQEILLDMDIVDLIADVISKVSNEAVFIECMKLSIGLTIGGNEKGQTKFYEAFNKGLKHKTLYSNKTEDWVLEKIKQKLDSCIKVVREVYEEMNEIVVKFSSLGNSSQSSEYKKALQFYDNQAMIYLKTAQKIYRFL